MPGLGLGLSKGLSYVNDWEKDIDRVYQREEYAARVKFQKEQETMFYAGLMKKGHGSTPYVEGKLNSFYKEHTKKVADFAINNPNFRTDVSKMQEFLNLNDQFLNNPILQQDLQVKQNFERLQTAVASKQITQAHFDREMKKYTDYAYADPNTDADPYVFANPLTIDLNKTIQEAQAITPTIEYVRRKGNQIETYRGVDPTAVMNTATSLLQDPENGEDNTLAFQNEMDKAIERNPMMKGLYPDLTTYVASRIEAGNKIQQVREDYDEAYLRGLSNSKSGAGNTPGQYFMRHIFPGLQALKDGERMSGDMHGLPMTVFREIGRPVTMTPDPDNPTYVYSTAEKKLVPLAVTISMEATNFTGYINIGGKHYGEISVAAGSGLLNSDGSKKTNGAKMGEPKLADEFLTDIGFTSNPTTPGSIQSAMMLGSSPGKEYSGKVWVPLDMSTSSLVDVDRSYGGLTEVAPASDFYSDRETQITVNDLQRGITRISMVDDPVFINDVGKGYEYIKVNGSNTDANGEKYVRNLTTGEISTY